MKTDWTRPFDKFATVLYRHDSDDVFWMRPVSEAVREIPEKTYVRLEYERKAWYEEYRSELVKAEAARQSELLSLRQRKMVRDGLEQDADEVLAKLDKWKRYVDADRWRQLGAWLDKHPQRWKEEDHLFALLDGIDWDNPFAKPLPKLDELRTHRRGRPRGTTNSEESKAKQSAAAREHWTKLKEKGWQHPKRLQSEKKDETPY